MEIDLMSQVQLTETATFLLRVALGIMFIAHSLILKLFIFTLPGTAQFFDSIGLPGWLSTDTRTVDPDAVGDDIREAVLIV